MLIDEKNWGWKISWLCPYKEVTNLLYIVTKPYFSDFSLFSLSLQTNIQNSLNNHDNYGQVNKYIITNFLRGAFQG
jgi:hypothetical protein